MAGMGWRRSVGQCSGEISIACGSVLETLKGVEMLLSRFVSAFGSVAVKLDVGTPVQRALRSENDRMKLIW